MSSTKMQAEIERVVDNITKVDTEHRVEFIVLYGSSVKKKHGGLSDVDLAVYYQGSREERFRFRMKVLGRSSDRFDIQMFQDLPLYIRKDIVSNGKPLYYKDYEMISHEYLRTIREYGYFEKHLNYYYSNLRGAQE